MSPSLDALRRRANAARASRSTVTTDVCVVGAGPAGMTLAGELGAKGLRVCVVETGGDTPDRAARRLSRGRSTAHPYPDLSRVRTRGLGGTSQQWNLRTGWLARPLDLEDFEERDHIGGWPLSGDELAAYYRRAHDACRLPSDSYDPDDWDRRSPNQRLPLPTTHVQTAMFQYGHVGFASRCAELLTEGVTLLRGTVVELLHAATGSAVRGVTVATDAGPATVVARCVVLAGGGVENARLLLLDGRHGPVSRTGDRLVGRFFMERVAVGSGVLVPADPDVLDTLGFYRRHDVDGVTIRGTLQLPPDVRRSEGLLNCALFLDRLRPQQWATAGVQSLRALRIAAQRRPWTAELGAHLANVRRDSRAVAAMAAHRLRLGARLEDRVVAIVVQGEPHPNAASRVRLGRRRDRLGLPLAELEWRPTSRERTSVRRTQELVSEALRQAGVGHLRGLLGDERPAAAIEGSHHHLGTTRMHEDPAEGVVDPTCRVHGFDNLYVAGSSVFPTAGCANPTLTIVALALRLADHLAG